METPVQVEKRELREETPNFGNGDETSEELTFRTNNGWACWSVTVVEKYCLEHSTTWEVVRWSWTYNG